MASVESKDESGMTKAEEISCPYCGKTHGVDREEACKEVFLCVICEACGKTFEVEVEVAYSTHKLPFFALGDDAA